MKLKDPFVWAACLTALILGGPASVVFAEASAAVPRMETATFGLG